MHDAVKGSEGCRGQCKAGKGAHELYYIILRSGISRRPRHRVDVRKMAPLGHSFVILVIE